MNVFFMHHRTKHHAKHSGYAKLIDVIDSEVIYPDTSFSYTLAKYISALYSQKKGIYDTSSVLKNISLFKALLKKRKELNIVHFLNGERDIRHLLFFKRCFPNTKFIATLHKPANVLETLVPDKSSLKNLDGIIVVGKSQLNHIKKNIGVELVSYIPHGVDAQFFKPPHNEYKNKQILFVGQHLRCFKTFNEVVGLLSQNHPEIEVKMVINTSVHSKIETFPNTTIINKIDDLKLLELYQNSFALVLPLLDVTACNSILEAMACGLPIITTDLESNRAYLKDSKNILVDNNDAHIMVKEILNLITNSELLQTLGKQSRVLSLDYDWQNISKLILEFYQNLTIEDKT